MFTGLQYGKVKKFPSKQFRGFQAIVKPNKIDSKGVL